MSRWASILLAASGLLAGCSTPKPLANAPRFETPETANVIIRYYSDSTSFMLKPEKLEGSFRSLLSKEQVLEIARQNQGRDLAVVVIGIYPTKAEEDLVMQGWLEPLKAMGYRQTLFLRGGRELEVKGLPIVQNSEPVTAFSGTGS